MHPPRLIISIAKVFMGMRAAAFFTRLGASDGAFAQEVFADERRVGLGVLRVGASREDAVAGCAVGAVEQDRVWW